MRYGLRYLVQVPIYVVREYNTEEEASTALAKAIHSGLMIEVQDSELRLLPPGQINSVYPYPIDDDPAEGDEQLPLPETE